MSKAGTVISGLDVTGTITVNASNVTIKNTRITGPFQWGVLVKPSASGVVIEDVEINGLGKKGVAGSDGVQGPATIQRANIYGVENGWNAQGSGNQILDNWIHDLTAPGQPHVDGLQIDGGVSNTVIRHNFIDVSMTCDNSAVMIDNGFGPISNIVVDGNRLLCGNYTVYSDGNQGSDPISGVVFTNNRLGKGGYGYVSTHKNSPVFTGNVDDTTGKAVTLNS